jgi:hypothetical protein
MPKKRGTNGRHSLRSLTAKNANFSETCLYVPRIGRATPGAWNVFRPAVGPKTLSYFFVVRCRPSLPAAIALVVALVHTKVHLILRPPSHSDLPPLPGCVEVLTQLLTIPARVDDSRAGVASTVLANLRYFRGCLRVVSPYRTEWHSEGRGFEPLILHFVKPCVAMCYTRLFLCANIRRLLWCYTREHNCIT